MFFNETKNAMSKEEYDSLLMQYSIEKLPKDRFLERDECLSDMSFFVRENRKN